MKLSGCPARKSSGGDGSVNKKIDTHWNIGIKTFA